MVFIGVKKSEKTSNVPIIFISSRIDNMDQIMAIQMGEMILSKNHLTCH